MGKWLEKANKHAEEVLEQRTRALRSLFPPGKWVEIDSPLFGRCSGWLIEVNADVFTITEHSVLKERMKIPAVWVISR